MSPVAAACASGASGEGDAEVVAGGAVVVGGTAAVVGAVVDTGCFAPPQPARNKAARTSGNAYLTMAPSLPPCAEVRLNDRNPVRPRSACPCELTFVHACRSVCCMST